MEYFIIGLLVLLIVLVIILILKDGKKDVEKLDRLEINVIKEISDFKSDFSRSLTEDFNNQTERLDKRLRLIDDRVNERLDENFEKTNKTFTNVLERLSKIDEAQKKIDALSTDIVSLQGVLTDKKTRGIFGEVNLDHILSNVFGKNNTKIYEIICVRLTIYARQYEDAF